MRMIAKARKHTTSSASSLLGRDALVRMLTPSAVVLSEPVRCVERAMEAPANVANGRLEGVALLDAWNDGTSQLFCLVEMVIEHRSPRLIILLLCLHVVDDDGYQLLERPVKLVKRVVGHGCDRQGPTPNRRQ